MIFINDSITRIIRWFLRERTMQWLSLDVDITECSIFSTCEEMKDG
jgi:hypothetical protein